MPDFINHYQNLEEAQRRLRDSVITYEGEPYYVLNIGPWHSDDIFRVYMLKLDEDRFLENYELYRSSPYDHLDANTRGKGGPIYRKMMNSPAFNRFRPFPLGMLNHRGRAYYVTRQPYRMAKEQGLIQDMVISKRVSNPSLDMSWRPSPINIHSKDFHNLVVGDYPEYCEAYHHMSSPACSNEGVAFCRDMAIVNGPCNSLLLAFRDEIVGVLLSSCTVKLEDKFWFLREALEESNIFQSIITGVNTNAAA